jgi:hypothetical protein
MLYHCFGISLSGSIIFVSRIALLPDFLIYCGPKAALPGTAAMVKISTNSGQKGSAASVCDTRHAAKKVFFEALRHLFSKTLGMPIFAHYDILRYRDKFFSILLRILIPEEDMISGDHKREKFF